MKFKMLVVALSAALGCVSATAGTRGCLAGAAVGGVGGHVAGHHGVLGAAAGCAVGHYVEKRRGQRVARHGGRQALAHGVRHHPQRRI